MKENERKSPPLQTTGEEDDGVLSNPNTPPTRSAREEINSAILGRMIASQKSEEEQGARRAEIAAAIERARIGETTPDYCFEAEDPWHKFLLEYALADVRAEQVRRDREAAKLLALQRKQRGSIR